MNVIYYSYEIQNDKTFYYIYMYIWFIFQLDFSRLSLYISYICEIIKYISDDNLCLLSQDKWYVHVKY